MENDKKENEKFDEQVNENEPEKKQEKEEQEISDKELDQASGGGQAVRDGRVGGGNTQSPEGHWWTAAQDDK